MSIIERDQQLELSIMKGYYNLLKEAYRHMLIEDILWHQGKRKGLKMEPLKQWEESEVKGALDIFNMMCERED